MQPDAHDHVSGHENPPKLLVNARRYSFIGGAALIAASFILGLVSIQAIPGIPLREVGGSFALNQGITFTASALGILIGIVFCVRGWRGFEEMQIESDSVVLPVRKFSDAVKGRPTRIRRASIEEAILRKNTRGTAVVVFCTKSVDGGSRDLIFALGWAGEPLAFIEELDKWVPMRRDLGWEELWHEWRLERKR